MARLVCLRTGQHFYTYEGMMRYVNYAREAQLPVYMANFDFGKDYKLNVDDLTPEAIINNVEVMESTEFDEKVSGSKANHLPREVRKVHEVCEVQLCQEQKPVETINVEAFSLWNTASNDKAPAPGVTASNVEAPAPGFTAAASNVEAPSLGSLVAMARLLRQGSLLAMLMKLLDQNLKSPRALRLRSTAADQRKMKRLLPSRMEINAFKVVLTPLDFLSLVN